MKMTGHEIIMIAISSRRWSARKGSRSRSVNCIHSYRFYVTEGESLVIRAVNLDRRRYIWTEWEFIRLWKPGRSSGCVIYDAIQSVWPRSHSCAANRANISDRCINSYDFRQFYADHESADRNALPQYVLHQLSMGFNKIIVSRRASRCGYPRTNVRSNDRNCSIWSQVLSNGHGSFNFNTRFNNWFSIRWCDPELPNELYRGCPKLFERTSV